MSGPAVSVVLPVYNGEDYLSCAIESVLGQTFEDFELVVVDDGSKDRTPEVARSYEDARVRYVRQENGGVAVAFNHGIRLARGRYVSWLSHDDLFRPDKLGGQADALEQLGEPGVCYTDIQFIDAAGRVTEERELEGHARGETLRHMLTAGSVSLAAYSVMYDRRCVEQVGLYDEAQRYTQDADMLIRLARRFPFVRVPQKLMQVRRHAAQGSADPRWIKAAELFYRDWLDTLSLEELFPELKEAGGRTARARARQWLGDAFARHPSPPYTALARSQYAKALLESPAVLPSLAPRVARLARQQLRNNRQFYRLGLRSALARRLGGAKGA
jgi:glycosyltransferase involved in cell wall biosynthesis